jgi:phosphatidylinositol-3-phosphatase
MIRPDSQTVKAVPASPHIVPIVGRSGACHGAPTTRGYARVDAPVLTAKRTRRPLSGREAVVLLIWLGGLLAGLSACGSRQVTAQDSAPASADRPPPTAVCGTSTQPPSRIQHVIVIMLENHSYHELIGPPHSAAAQQAPYLNRLADSCGLATNYHNVTHPSLPNYLAATGGSTFGITYDCQGCATSAPSIFSQVASAGRSWAVYAESMSTPCRATDDLAVEYTAHHNPPIFYRSLRSSCPAHDLPMGTPRHGRLATALRTGKLATYVFMAPNRCNDMHDCSIHTGDTWLAWWMNTILSSRVYRTQPTAIFITVDEGNGGTIGRGEICRQHPTDESCHIPLIIVGRDVRRHSRDNQPMDHYALLRASEQLLGLPPLASAASAPDMLPQFGLTP